MSDEIKKTGGKQPGRIPEEEFELKEIKHAKKPTAPKGTGEISHAAKETSKKEKALDGNNPMLSTPQSISKEQADQIRTNLEKKLTQPTTYNELRERVEKGSLDVQTRINKTTNDINKVLQSDASFENKTFQIQLILLEHMNISLDIGAEYGKSISLEQAEQKKEQFDLLLKQQEVERKAKTTSLISKIFGWIGDIVNLIFAAIAVVATALASPVTTGMIVGATAWMAGAILGIAARGCDESGALKDKPQWIGIAMTFTGIALSLGGMGLGGASGALQAGQAASQTIVNAVMYTERTTSFLRLFSQTATTITGAVVKLEIEGLRAEKVGKEKIQNQLEFAFNNMLRNQQNVLKSSQEHYERISKGYAESARTIGVIGGNIV